MHKTQAVADACKELRAQRIFNVPSSPDFNGIEVYLSLVKAEYKKLVLQRLLKGLKVESPALIRQSGVWVGLKNMLAKAQELNLA